MVAVSSSWSFEALDAVDRYPYRVGVEVAHLSEAPGDPDQVLTHLLVAGQLASLAPKNSAALDRPALGRPIVVESLAAGADADPQDLGGATLHHWTVGRHTGAPSGSGPAPTSGHPPTTALPARLRVFRQ